MYTYIHSLFIKDSYGTLQRSEIKYNWQNDDDLPHDVYCTTGAFFLISLSPRIDQNCVTQVYVFESSLISYEQQYNRINIGNYSIITTTNMNKKKTKDQP